MKRFIALLFLLLTVLSFVGCRQSANTVTVNFYYFTDEPEYHTQSSVIQAEKRKVGANLSDLEGILRLYMDGPISGKLDSPFPLGTVLKTVQPGKDVVEIVLSDEISKLSGIELMIACACLAKTVLEISRSEIVRIRAENALLNNQEYIEFTPQSFLSFS